MTTYLLRHAPTAHSLAHRINGDPRVNVPLTVDGEAACVSASAALPVEKIISCVASPFPRCRRTANLLLDGAVPITTDARLGELDYGAFEGEPFLTYADWLAEHGPWTRPPEAPESQREGIARMITGLRAVLTHPGPRLVVAHGLLLSVVSWALEHPHDVLVDVFLPEAPCLTPTELRDTELRELTTRLLVELEPRGEKPGYSIGSALAPLLPSVRTRH